MLVYAIDSLVQIVKSRESGQSVGRDANQALQRSASSLFRPSASTRRPRWIRSSFTTSISSLQVTNLDPATSRSTAAHLSLIKITGLALHIQLAMHGCTGGHFIQ